LILDKASEDLNINNTEDVGIVLELKDSVYEKKCESCKLI
jgi:hypothetical protein